MDGWIGGEDDTPSPNDIKPDPQSPLAVAAGKGKSKSKASKAANSAMLQKEHRKESDTKAAEKQAPVVPKEEEEYVSKVAVQDGSELTLA